MKVKDFYPIFLHCSEISNSLNFQIIPLETYSTLKRYHRICSGSLTIAGLIFICVLVLSISAFGAKPVCVPCGDTCYDPSKQSCCQGQVYDGLHFGVCGDTCYNMESQVCCNTIVLNGSRCLPTCGNSFYTPTNQSCCLGEPKDGLLWGVCGGVCYDLTSQSCCNNQIYDGFGWQICGDTCYNTKNQSCCLGEVYDGKGFTACGDTCYSPKTETCCKGKVLEGKVECVY